MATARLPCNRVLLGTVKMPKGLLKIHWEKKKKEKPLFFPTTFSGYKETCSKIKSQGQTKHKPLPDL